MEILLFVLAFASFAYFHQGGGWNQNARFALTRALVESRVPWIDDYFIYTADASKGVGVLKRYPIRDGVFSAEGQQNALAWKGPDGTLTAMAPGAPPGARLVTADRVAASGDYAFAYGHVHPNKAPGTSFAAVPAYAAVFVVERMLGIDPDGVWAFTVNAWLSGVFSVGLIAALGVVAFWRLALRLVPDRPAAALFATLALAFGTLYFPYATMLFEHDLVAAALLGSVLLLYDDGPPRRFFWGGVLAGCAIVGSYLSVVAAAVLGVYVFLRRRGGRPLVAYAAGLVPPLAVLAAYNLACFGTIFATNYAWENPIFKQAPGGSSGLFGTPQPDVALALLISPMRGMFTIMPVLLIGVLGLVAMMRVPALRPLAWLFLALFAYVFAFNVSFNNWQGGWACGPRYLLPGLPFVALPIVFARRRYPGLRYALLGVSIAGMSLATVVDPQTPIKSPDPWQGSPVWSIDAPQWLHGKPGAFASASLSATTLAGYVEPVSANSFGMYSGAAGRGFPAGSPQSLWNSFNAGELLFPGSRLSVLPWLAFAAGVGGLIRRELERPA